VTLVLALQAIDGIVLACDSRATIGDPRSFMVTRDVSKKVFQLSERCGIGIGGSSELGDALISSLQRQLASKKLTYVEEISSFTRQHLRTLYNEWFQQFPLDRRPLMGAIVAGYEETLSAKMIPKIYAFSSDFDYAPLFCSMGFYVLGVPLLASYLLNRFYDPNSTKEGMAALAEYIISEVASQDPKVGGETTIQVISPYSDYKELEPAKVAEIHRRNEEQNHKFKEYFSNGR
jgi:20S proteasome alpha/beta subunit